MENRRKFLQTTGRNAVLAAFGFLGIFGIFSHKIKADVNAACPTSLSCQNCSRLKSCANDQAKKYIKEKKAPGSGLLFPKSESCYG